MSIIYFTPPEIARRLRVSPAKVLTWVHSGALRAMNLAADPGGSRPRYRILMQDLLTFEASRAVTPKVRGRRRRQGNAIDFF